MISEQKPRIEGYVDYSPPHIEPKYERESETSLHFLAILSVVLALTAFALVAVAVIFGHS